MVVFPLRSDAASTTARSGMPPEINKRAPRGPMPSQPAVVVRPKTAPYVAPRLAGAPAPAADTARKQAPTARPPAGALRRETPSPVKPGLNINVTPRSGPRKTRTDSASTTPNGTPSGTPKPSRPVSTIVGKDTAVERPSTAVGIGIQGVNLPPKSRPASVIGGVSPVSGYMRNPSPERPQVKPDGDAQSPMFFHASDAPTAAATPKAAPLKSKSSAFFYANGPSDAQQPDSDASPAPISPTQTRFFHANGAPEVHTATASTRHTPSSSLSRPTPKLPTLVTAGRTTSARSTSPLKEIETLQQPTVNPSMRNAPVASNASSRGRPDNGEASFNSRRGSLQSFVSTGYHQKSQSIHSTDASSSARLGPGPDTVGRISDASSSFVSEPDSLEPVPAQLDYVSFQPMSPASPLASPSHSAFSPVAASDTTLQTKLSQAQEMAAQARRERKVLDLEISNSSLLAINRTLEREMRKQKAELRRYKRLTSSGRLSLLEPNEGRPSLANTNASELSPIDGSDDDEERLGLSGEEDEDDDLSSLSSDSTSSSDDPSAADEEAAVRRRAKDAKRLRLDLDRHRAILADSQALNQSLKRCLGRTEALISEGRRALDHKVRVSEVHIGGRVLDADEVPDSVELDPQQRRGLLSPSLRDTARHADGDAWPGQPSGADAPTSPLSPSRSYMYPGVVPFVRQATTSSSPEKELLPAPFAST